MNIQSINQQTNKNIGFQKLIVKKGSFNVLKNAEYFPDKSYPNYYRNLKVFSKKLIELRKECEGNDLYNVVIEPNRKGSLGGMYIENREGIPQTGFFKSFKDILEVDSKRLRPVLTNVQEPKFFDRVFKNWKIRRYNKKVENQKVTMQEFLNSVYKKLQEMVNNADYLIELHNLKKAK